jgi:hypothetical protein
MLHLVFYVYTDCLNDYRMGISPRKGMLGLRPVTHSLLAPHPWVTDLGMHAGTKSDEQSSSRNTLAPSKQSESVCAYTPSATTTSPLTPATALDPPLWLLLPEAHKKEGH